MPPVCFSLWFFVNTFCFGTYLILMKISVHIHLWNTYYNLRVITWPLLAHLKMCYVNFWATSGLPSLLLCFFLYSIFSLFLRFVLFFHVSFCFSILFFFFPLHLLFFILILFLKENPLSVHLWSPLSLPSLLPSISSYKIFLVDPFTNKHTHLLHDYFLTIKSSWKF